MRLSEADILQLLPTFMREDDAVAALASGSNEVIRQLANSIRLLSTWDHVADMAGKELDELAWELGIPWYDSAATDEAKRMVIKQSDQVYAKLGTKWAVEQIVTAYFGTGVVREWWEYGGDPFHFKILSDNPELVNTQLSKFMALLETVKRKSAWMDAILITLTGEMTVYFGMAIRDHNVERHSLGADVVLE
ncbi:MAG: phage tail protein I [Candidatus Dehalobacter alkaniphilus]